MSSGRSVKDNRKRKNVDRHELTVCKIRKQREESFQEEERLQSLTVTTEKLNNYGLQNKSDFSGFKVFLCFSYDL